MRKIDIGTQKHTVVYAVDEPSFGGACHHYNIGSSKLDEAITQAIKFQKGPIKEHGVNGIHNEDLIAIVLDRLRSFQAGEYACGENSIAVAYLEEVLRLSRQRTDRRTEAGIEGTSQKDPDVPTPEQVLSRPPSLVSGAVVMDKIQQEKAAAEGMSVLDDMHNTDPTAEAQAKADEQKPPVETCHECGCTDDNCSECVAETGEPCYWVSHGKCSRCFDGNGELKVRSTDEIS